MGAGSTPPAEGRLHYIIRHIFIRHFIHFLLSDSRVSYCSRTSTRRRSYRPGTLPLFVFIHQTSQGLHVVNARGPGITTSVSFYLGGLLTRGRCSSRCRFPHRSTSLLPRVFLHYLRKSLELLFRRIPWHIVPFGGILNSPVHSYHVRLSPSSSLFPASPPQSFNPLPFITFAVSTPLLDCITHHFSRFSSPFFPGSMSPPLYPVLPLFSFPCRVSNFTTQSSSSSNDFVLPSFLPIVVLPVVFLCRVSFLYICAVVLCSVRLKILGLQARSDLLLAYQKIN